MNKILFLDNSIANDTYRPLDYWKPLLLFPFDLFRVSASEMPSDLADYSHVIITGSTASVLQNTNWMQAEAELIRKATAAGKVILGSCFGHQLIACSLFGMDSVRPREIPEIGWPEIEVLTDDALLGESGRSIYNYVFHYDEVCRVPEESAIVIARSATCSIQGFKLKNKPVWGIQPHFEMGIVEGLNYLDLAAGNGIPTRTSFLESDQDYPKDSGWVIPLMRAFHGIRPIT